MGCDGWEFHPSLLDSETCGFNCDVVIILYNWESQTSYVKGQIVNSISGLVGQEQN